MTRLMNRMALAAALVCVTTGVSLAQQTSTATETKSFEVISVEGNRLVVRLPEGTKALDVPDDFRFTVNGQPLSVSELKPGMNGTATITTRTTVTPVTVTEVKNGTVVQRAGGSIIVRTAEGMKMFSQGDVDKRGVKMIRGGEPAQLSDFREGDQLTATIITTKPPRIVTEKEVRAMVPTPAPAAPAAPVADAPTRAATLDTARTPVATTAQARKLPKTASAWPLLAFASLLSLATGLTLTTIRRRHIL
jgi:hypothetical protein